eukprot:2836075-Rhodomonas_salina.1
MRKSRTRTSRTASEHWHHVAEDLVALIGGIREGRREEHPDLSLRVRGLKVLFHELVPVSTQDTRVQICIALFLRRGFDIEVVGAPPQQLQCRPPLRIPLVAVAARGIPASAAHSHPCFRQGAELISACRAARRGARGRLGVSKE